MHMYKELHIMCIIIIIVVLVLYIHVCHCCQNVLTMLITQCVLYM